MKVAKAKWIAAGDERPGVVVGIVIVANTHGDGGGA